MMTNPDTVMAELIEKEQIGWEHTTKGKYPKYIITFKHTYCPTQAHSKPLYHGWGDWQTDS